MEPLLDPAVITPLASPWKRLGAVLLDGLLACAAVLPGVLLATVGGGDTPLVALGVVLAIAGFFGFFGYQLYLLSTEGQTVAKRALHLRIVGIETEENPGFGRAVGLRTIVPAVIGCVPFLGGLFALADALFIFRDDRRCLHDHIASTKVVDETVGADWT
ncbi:MAG TPA: RDD family protein [Rubricoccaceae bacterium]|nr:RDD family protein [Rubricoccaceae bacterium]